MSERAIIAKGEEMERAQKYLEELLETLVSDPVSRSLITAAATKIAYVAYDAGQDVATEAFQNRGPENSHPADGT